jgi:glycerophosphoryl diester phosphodiesterase
VSERHPSILWPPVGFSLGGANAHERPNTAAAFALALRLGATGLSSGLWLSQDGVPLLSLQSAPRRGLRRKALSDTPADDLPDNVVTLEALYSALGVETPLHVAIGDPEALQPALEVARRARDSSGQSALPQLWLSHPDWEYLAELRPQVPEVRLFNSGRLESLGTGPERRAAQLSSANIDGMSMHFTDWTGGLVVLFRRFEVLAMATAAEHLRQLDEVLRMGVDAVSSIHADRLSDALGRLPANNA